MTTFGRATKLGCVVAVLAAWAVGPSLVQAADDMEKVELKLPKPAFIGTPKNPPPGLVVEPPRKGPREPLMAPKGTVNLAAKRPVTASDKEPIIGTLEQVTDGDKEASDGSWVELGPGLQWVQIDLGQPSDIYGFLVWHHHGDPRVYKDVVVQVADDEDFITNVKTVFNNDTDNTSGLGIGKEMMYFENFEGKLIPVKDGVKGRYVRLYSKGNTSDDQNHYTEIEVFGVPAK
jgi:hypothetical protein